MRGLHLLVERYRQTPTLQISMPTHNASISLIVYWSVDFIWRFYQPRTIAKRYLFQIFIILVMPIVTKIL